MTIQSLTRVYGCLNCTLRTLPPLQKTFATSAILHKYGAVPSFHPSSNPELDAHLQTIRNKIFLPVHLSKSQKDLIYLDSNKRELSIEPVFAHIKGEKFQLEHIDRMKDIPSTRDCVRGSMNLMREPKDWDNIPSLFHGLNNAKRSALRDLLAVTRKAGMAGRADVMVECARRLDDTSCSLKNARFAWELLYQIQRKALKSGWAAKETRQALSLAETVYALLDDARHGGGIVKNQPRITGILLQLSAVWATKFCDGADAEGKVRLYAERLLATPPDAHVLLSSQPDTPVLPTMDINKDSTLLSSLAPVLQGLRLATPILGEVEGLATRREELEAFVAELRMALPDEPAKNGLPPRGIATFCELLGPDAVKVERVIKEPRLESNTVKTTVEA